MEDVYKWVWFSKTLQRLLLQTKSTDSHLSDGWWMSNGCLRTFDALKAAYFHFPSCCPILPSKLELQTKVREDFTITVKAPTRAFSYFHFC